MKERISRYGAFRFLVWHSIELAAAFSCLMPVMVKGRIRSSVRNVLFIALFALIGAGTGLGLAHSTCLDSFIPGKGQWNGWTLPGIPFTWFIASAFHELGHLWTGLVQGFRFEAFIVGFLAIQRKEDDRIRVGWNANWSTFGGLAATAPREFRERTIQPFGNVLLAGPVTSFILWILAWSVLPLLPTSTTFFAFIIGLMSLVIFLAVTVPSRTGMFYTDHKKYQRLRSGSAARDIELAYLRTGILKMRGQPLQQMTEEELRRLTQDDAVLFRCFGWLYLWEFGEGNPVLRREVREELEFIRPEIPRFMWQHLQKFLAQGGRSKETFASRYSDGN